MGERVCYLEFCPECDLEVAPDDEECPACGATLEE
ncbi:MAG: zinc-ribbon domain-containing protein [Haloarculaceae archaeon]